MSVSVLLVDDETAIHSAYSKCLSQAGFGLRIASSLAQARSEIGAKKFDAILLDLSLPDGNGLDWIVELRETRPEVAIVVITGTGDIPSAVEAMRRGADHFLSKPVNLDDLEVFLRKSLELGSLRKRTLAHRRLAKPNAPFFGESPAILRTLPQIRLASENDSIVLLYGETGTGKGVFARWIHSHSDRRSMPFVEVNCSGLMGELISSELFGHARGAFTSAVEAKQGLLDVADGGTLFLDEIGDMDFGIQSQFLKVLEEKRYRRLGEVQERQSDFRLICATNRDLFKETQEGRFRKDLFFRINVIPIEVPSMRERIQDLAGLVSYLFSALDASHMEVTPEAMSVLKAYSWPGNVRELKNVIERAILLSRRRGPIGPEHFPGLTGTAFQPGYQHIDNPYSDSSRLEEVLVRVGGDKKKAAEALGISRATLYRKLKDLRSRHRLR